MHGLGLCAKDMSLERNLTKTNTLEPYIAICQYCQLFEYSVSDLYWETL